MANNFIGGWEGFTVLPPENGRYVVGHRGRIFGSAYFLNGVWIQQPDFRPTHWLSGGYDKLAETPMDFPRMEEQLGYLIKVVW